MGFWDFLIGGGVNHAGDIPNANPPSSVGAGQGGGDPHGVEVDQSDVVARSLPTFHPSPWAGWPAEWWTPNWDWASRFNELVDVAWTMPGQERLRAVDDAGLPDAGTGRSSTRRRG